MSELPRLTVIGEALIDLVPADREVGQGWPGGRSGPVGWGDPGGRSEPVGRGDPGGRSGPVGRRDTAGEAPPGRYEARPGGSPFNVAVSLARLEHRVTLMARLADNPFGRLLREHATAERIDLSHAPAAAEPTTLAVVGLDREGRATYDFYLEGTADWQWSADEIARVPDDTAVFHMGSLASWTAPGDGKVYDAAARLRRDGRALVSYDPNVRPAILGDPGRARALVERSVGTAHLVKASREDTEWLYEGAGLQEVSRRWLGLGALLVVITDGPDGAHLFRDGSAPVHRPGLRVQVADTIGAGDAFTAGLLGGLALRGLHAPEPLRRCPPGLLAEAVDEAVLVSALTCERVGADPPTRSQFARSQRARSELGL